MDAIDMLEEDHRKVKELFSRFEDAGEDAHRTKEDLVGPIDRELRVHSQLEEQIFYPAARNSSGETTEDVREAIEEHHVVDQLLDEIEDMRAEDEQYDAKVTVLIENVRHHIEEEEGELFPEVRKALSDERLEELGQEMEALKRQLS